MPHKSFKSHPKLLLRDNTNFYCLPFYDPFKESFLSGFSLISVVSITDTTPYSPKALRMVFAVPFMPCLHQAGSSGPWTQQSNKHHVWWSCNHTKLLDFEVHSTMTEVPHTFPMVTFRGLRQRPLSGCVIPRPSLSFHRGFHQVPLMSVRCMYPSQSWGQAHSSSVSLSLL